MGVWIFQKRFQKYRISCGSLDPKFQISNFPFGFIFKDFKPKGREQRAVSGEAARSGESANVEAMYIKAVCTQGFSASSLQFLSTPDLLVNYMKYLLLGEIGVAFPQVYPLVFFSRFCQKCCWKIGKMGRSKQNRQIKKRLIFSKNRKCLYISQILNTKPQ